MTRRKKHKPGKYSIPSRLWLTLLLLLAVGSSFVFLLDHARPPSAKDNSKALIGGGFSLIDHRGQAVSDQTFAGRYRLVYFGYSFCPDICPTELQIMADALDRLPAATAAEIQPIFITIDPERDTVDVLAQYVAAFHPALTGLTGSLEQISAVKAAYRIYGAKEKILPGQDPAAYLMSHSSYIYLMDRDDVYVTHFKSQTDPAEMAEKIKRIIR